jgi:hypothetical protein
MDIHEALEAVECWCAEQTAAGDPDAVEVVGHATVWITVGECAPPWRVRSELGSSAGASAPIAQLRYDTERRTWALHHGGGPGQAWCDDEAALHSDDIPTLIAELDLGIETRYPRLLRHGRWGCA